VTPANPVRHAVVVELRSDLFADGENIPAWYTCEGEDVSPSLHWSGVPDGTVQLALTLEDPDAPGGVFVHWVAWGLAPERRGLQEGEVPAEMVQGTNSFGEVGYRGPCPPHGHGPHRYVFTLLALDADPELPGAASIDQLRRACAGHVLAEATLTGYFERV